MTVPVLVIVAIINSFIPDVQLLSSTIYPIGGLFTQKTESSSAQVFKNMIKIKGERTFKGRLIIPKASDAYSTALEVCSSTEDDRGIVALIDARPTDGICDSTCLLCNKLQINYLSIGWQLPEFYVQDSFTFYYHPPPDVISKAYATLIRLLQWDKFAIFYENDDSFTRLQEVINTWAHTNEAIQYVKLDPDGDNREAFKSMFKVEHLSYHVIDCDVRRIKKYMKEIVQVENSTQYQSIILTSLDAYTVNFEDIPDLVANVSTLHLTLADVTRWKDNKMNTIDTRLETALTADALDHLEKGLRLMQQNIIQERDDSRSFKLDNQPPSLCITERSNLNESFQIPSPWQYGGDLRKALIETTSYGFTGNVEFDAEGKRKKIILNYSKMDKSSKFVHVGEWNSITDIITMGEPVDERPVGLKAGSTIRIASRVGKPYFDYYDVNGTMELDGYAVDLIKSIFAYINTKTKLDLKYEFYRVKGDKYGNKIEGTKKWDGLIGDLLEHNADLAICDITITLERNSVVDFSSPFMTLGISLLMKEEEPEPPNMFSFMQPLSLEVWLYLATSYILASYILLICARMSQADWVNPHPCERNPERLENIWSLYNCTWLTMGAIMTQGCDILPRGGASRWTTSVWWFFALIITSSYTANMSAFLSNNLRNNDIKDAKSLSEQTKVSYGAVYNASTYKFFKKSNDTVYSKLWQVMDAAKPTVFMTNNEEGRDRVLRSKGNYAFFMESTTIEYYTNRFCDLKMVGDKLDSKEYGIALPKNSPLKSEIDNAIIALQEAGQLENLKTKWWEEKDNEGKCQLKKKQKAEEEKGLQMKNTSGIFLVLGVGGVMGMIVALIDFLVHAQKIAVKEKISFKEAVVSEWRVSFNPRTVKPAAPPRSAAPSLDSSPHRDRSRSRAVSVLKAATSFINFDEIY